jgi:hypothetical protein
MHRWGGGVCCRGVVCSKAGVGVGVGPAAGEGWRMRG